MKTWDCAWNWEWNLLKFTEFLNLVTQLESIDYNTAKRKEATSSFLQNLFKLFINSVFGKTMECIRNSINLKLFMNPITANKLIARPTFQRLDIINKDLMSITMMKDKVVLNRPIYLGFFILDLSKITMYRFHYQQIIAKYGNKAIMTYTDTDSFVYLIETKNIYDDMAANIDAFDTSKYPTTHLLHSQKNAKTLGKFKDERNSIQPHELIGLRSKMYSLKLPNGRIKITAKGVSRSHVRKNLKHKDYLHTLQTTKSSYATLRTITSHKNAVKTQEVNKLFYRHLTTSDTFYLMAYLLSLIGISESPNWTRRQKENN